MIFVLAALLTCLCTAAEVRVGAERADVYVPPLAGKRVALLSNHTGLVEGGRRHTLDLMLERGVNVTTLFSPEHGFRGNADAGAHVKDGTDPATGLPIASLYNGRGSSMPAPEVMERFDVIVCDLQDVGVRFYTYYITMLRLMNAAARYGKEFVVFDRPNPIGMVVDGPVLDMDLKSGVGALPLPVAHGLTLGEMAHMIVGEGWLDGGASLALTVIPCEGYTHATRYKLPVNPSPNLKSMHAIYLYPSTCLFEGTMMSLGRGTDRPFEIYGHPQMADADTTFTPRSVPGAANPPLKDVECRGRDLGGVSDVAAIAAGVDIDYICQAYLSMPKTKRKTFFNSMFDKLAGSREIRQRIIRGDSSSEIRRSWQADIEKYLPLREKYLLYPLE